MPKIGIRASKILLSGAGCPAFNTEDGLPEKIIPAGRSARICSNDTSQGKISIMYNRTMEHIHGLRTGEREIFFLMLVATGLLFASAVMIIAPFM